MVKNTGGNKAKGYARKNMVKGSSALRVSEDPSEIYAQAVKICGGAICRVTNLEGVEINCHIRGKFRGRGKKDNLITPGTWLLVGLREWEKEASPGKLLNCDLIEVYSDNDKTRLKNSVTSIDWSRFISNDTRTIGSTETSENLATEIVFADNKTLEYRALIDAHMEEQTKSGKTTTIVMDDEEINIDDI
jgi:translation initiation factor IF-1